LRVAGGQTVVGVEWALGLRRVLRVVLEEVLVLQEGLLVLRVALLLVGGAGGAAIACGGGAGGRVGPAARARQGRPRALRVATAHSRARPRLPLLSSPVREPDLRVEEEEVQREIRVIDWTLVID